MSWEHENILPNRPSIEGVRTNNLNTEEMEKLYYTYPWLLMDERSREPGFIKREMNLYNTNPEALLNAQRTVALRQANRNRQWEENRQRVSLPQPSIPLNTVTNTGSFNIERNRAFNAISHEPINNGEDIFYLLGEREIYHPATMNRLLRSAPENIKSPITRRNITSNTLRKAKARLIGGGKKGRQVALRTNPLNPSHTILQGEMEQSTYRKSPAGGRRRKTRRRKMKK